jgi:SPX domain protein involved in polyphosphate accumulation
MVDFGKKLLEKRVDGWEEYYIDYGRLKSLIKKASKAKKRKKEQQHNVQVQQRQQQGGRQRSNSDAVGYNYNFNGLTHNSSSSDVLGSKSTGLIDRMTQMSPSMRGGRLFINENNEFEDDRKSIHETVSDEYVTVLEFRSVLDYEIQKIVLFILTREGQLAQNLYTLSKDGQLLKTKILSLVYDYRQREGRIVNGNDKLNAWNHLKESTYSHRDFASNLLQFVNFIDMNVTGKCYSVNVSEI